MKLIRNKDDVHHGNGFYEPVVLSKTYTMSYLNISHIGNKHNEWISGLDFYKDDIHIMEQRLSDLAGHKLDMDAKRNMEHFQNQFIVQRNNIDELKHKINEHLKHLGKEAGLHAGHINQEMVREHEQLSEEYTMLEKVMNELRHDFNNYLSLHSTIAPS
jgi:seryl-tRNA synthetase